ncbi:MAG: hypothetical protein CBB70_11325 [Planctomycetaceae bacterium TMED10]|nr:MAG: hypothetical protein CBB70_11325 [Planctomycetaceae bacterium TMED10]
MTGGLIESWAQNFDYQCRSGKKRDSEIYTPMLQSQLSHSRWYKWWLLGLPPGRVGRWGQLTNSDIEG